MATATKKARATRRLKSVERSASAPSMEFQVFQDNGGRYCWTIVSESGEPLAQSPRFESYEDARAAAGRVREGAGSARLEPLEAVSPTVDLTPRPAVAAHADPDVERWLDEGGNHTVAVAAELPVPR
jgi:uncharacterized protein YegP (UPF0339 family)